MFYFLGSGDAMLIAAIEMIVLPRREDVLSYGIVRYVKQRSLQKGVGDFLRQT